MSKSTVKPQDQLGYLLTQASFLKQRITNAALKELDLTYAQFVILAGTYELSEEGDTVTQQTIAIERRLDKAMVSNVVKTLIEKELIIREEHPIDKRAFTLHVTPTGKEVAIRGREIAREIDEEFFANVDRKALRKILTLLLTNDSTDNDKQ